MLVAFSGVIFSCLAPVLFRFFVSAKHVAAAFGCGFVLNVFDCFHFSPRAFYVGHLLGT